MNKLSILISLSCLWLSACVSQTALQRSEQTRDSIRQEMLQASEPVEQSLEQTPPAVMDALMPPTGLLSLIHI